MGVFNVCLQDEGNPGTVFVGNSQTGAYRFCCGGTTYTGTATVVKHGNSVTFSHSPADRRVTVNYDGSALKGTASLQSPAGVVKCTINDRNTANNSCICQ